MSNEPSTSSIPTAKDLSIELQLAALGILSYEQLKARIEQRSEEGYLIEHLIAPRSITALIGDWGIGKTPFLVQLGLSVAAGVPFLSRPTKQARVLWMNFENLGRRTRLC